MINKKMLGVALLAGADPDLRDRAYGSLAGGHCNLRCKG